MQTATQRAAPVPAGGHINGFSSVVSDLKSLIAHVEASIKLIEAAIPAESDPGIRQSDANVRVRDEVAPPCAKANAALIACNLGLSAALQSLLGSSRDFVASKRPSVR